jgi:uncharacterized protein (DUF4415 family)
VKLKNIDVEAVVKAIEADAGEKLPGLRKSLQQAKRGEFGAVHTPQTIAERRRGRPLGSRKATSKVAVKLRLDPDVIAALRATGDGWQTRVNETLRATLKLTGQLPS